MKKGKIQKFISRLGKIGISFLMILTTLNLGRISNAFAANAENANSMRCRTGTGDIYGGTFEKAA